MIGSLLNNRYRLDDFLGRGGMGVVYRAHDTLLDRDVAVKLLSDAGLGTEGRARLLNEARAAAQLNHPNIVTVFDAGEVEQKPFIVMELIDGLSLDEHPPASLDELYPVALQICSALEDAHAHGIIHRDLKPENVLVTRSGTAKLTDFGLARSLASRMTSEGTIVGTVYYMAPEMMLGQPFDGRADLYALGVMLYELATGRLPFTADNPLGVISQHIHAPVVPPNTYRPDLPPELGQIILRLLEKDPHNRYANAHAARLALEAAQAAASAAGQPLVLGDPGSTPEPAAGGVDFGGLLEKLARGRLVGRRGEMEQLHRLWKSAQLGRIQLALLSGEPGVGKTRLANELIVYARLSGAPVLRGGCYEYEAATPYLPFIEALREWVRSQSSDELSRQVGDLAPELAKLAPEIGSRLGPFAASQTLAPNEERMRLFDHVARFLERLSQEKGLLLFIDDIHWVDQSSLALLSYLMRHLRPARMMVLAAYREVELDRSHPFSAALVDWNREHLANRLSLNRLLREDVGQLLAALFGVETLSDEFIQAIYAETEGNPFFVEEVIKALIEQGQIYRENGRWQRREVADLAIPQSIKEAVGRRLDRQSPACLEMLHTAAALGKRFQFTELRAVFGRAENDLLDVLDEAEAAQLIQAEDGETFLFTHDKIREVLYEELNPIRRRRLHLRIGEELERLYDLTPDVPDAATAIARACKLCVTGIQTLAYHFIEGGELEKGLGYSVQAAEKAQEVFALDDAHNYYDRAIECAEALGWTERLAKLYETVGYLHFQRGSYQEAVPAFSQALERYVLPQDRARVKMNLGMGYAQVGDERGMDFLQAAIQDLDPHTQPSQLGLAFAQLGRYYHYRADWDRAIENLEKARKIVEPLGDYISLTTIYSYLSGAYQQLGDFKTSIEWAQRTVALGEQENYLFAVAIGYEFLAEAHYVLTHWRQSLEYAALDKQIGQKIGSQSRLAWGWSAEAHAYYGLGDLEKALQAANECVAIVQHTDEKRLEVQIRALRGQIYILMNDLDAAQVDIDFAKDIAQASGQGQLLAWSYNALAAWHLARQEWEALLAVSEKCFQARGFRYDVLEAYACLALGRRDEVERWRRQFEALDQDSGESVLDRSPDHLWIYGLLLAYLGERQPAGQALNRAIELYQSHDSRLSLARAYYSRSCFYRDGGDLAAARSDAEQALDLFTTYGAKLYLELALQVLAEVQPS